MIRQTGIALALLLPLAPAGAQGMSPAAKAPLAGGKTAAITRTHQVYDVIRKGTKIGTDVIDVERQGDMTNIKMATNILVKVMFIDAYRYKHSANESWKGDQLVSFKSRTDDNGKKHTVTATLEPKKINLDVDGHRADVPKSIIPATLWNKDIGKHAELFDPADGKRMAVHVADMGMETLTVHGVPRKTHHYRISGDLQRDLWFDGDLLVRMTLVGSDNSVVTSELKTAAAAPQ